MKIPSLILAGLLSASLSAHAGKTVFSDIHGDFDIGFEDGELKLIFHDHTHDVEYNPKDVVLQVNGNAKTTAPDNPAYSFLGNPGEAVWILPAVQDPNILFLGTASEEVPSGIFQGDTVRLSLISAKGPGKFAMFAINPFGVPVILMNTRDGVDASDGVNAPAGGHTDYNFAFSKPGTYHITLEASGTLLDGTVVSSGKVTYTFKVRQMGKVVFSDIHGDFDIGFEDGELGLILHDHTHDVEYDPKDVVLQVNGNAKTTAPHDPAYSFLGKPGDAVWILPAVQNPTLLFLGTASEEVAPGIFQGDTVRLSLISVKGPGEFAMYAIDPFGVPVVLMNTRDGVDASDGVNAPAGGHTDYNFALSKPGTYHITMEASGTLLDGTVVSSGKVTYTFKVLRPSPLDL